MNPEKFGSLIPDNSERLGFVIFSFIIGISVVLLSKATLNNSLSSSMAQYFVVTLSGSYMAVTLLNIYINGIEKGFGVTNQSLAKAGLVSLPIAILLSIPIAFV